MRSGNPRRERFFDNFDPINDAPILDALLHCYQLGYIFCIDIIEGLADADQMLWGGRSGILSWLLDEKVLLDDLFHFQLFEEIHGIFRDFFALIFIPELGLQRINTEKKSLQSALGKTVDNHSGIAWAAIDFVIGKVFLQQGYIADGFVEHGTIAVARP